MEERHVISVIAPPGPPEIVLFDLGGVLMQFGGITAMRELSGIDSEDELWRRWLSCRWVRSFESGRCTPEEFAAGMVADWQLELASEAFVAQFRSWVVGLFDGAYELVQETKARARVGCLSNTNPLHWDGEAVNWPLSELFDVRFLSHQIGLLKPDREVFEHVVDALGTPATAVLFLDDNLANVEQARAVGLRAEQVRGVGEARAALVGHGVLDPG